MRCDDRTNSVKPGLDIGSFLAQQVSLGNFNVGAPFWVKITIKGDYAEI